MCKVTSEQLKFFQFGFFFMIPLFMKMYKLKLMFQMFLLKGRREFYSKEA